MRIFLLITTLLAAASAAAADNSQPDPEIGYINHLCSTAIAQPNAPRDVYLQQIKDMTMRSQSSSSLNKTEFDSDAADNVVDSWLAIDATQRQQANTQAGCEQLLKKQLQNQ